MGWLFPACPATSTFSPDFLEVPMHPDTNPDTRTLSELYSLWLASPHASKPNLTNAERSMPDQLNYRRALECFAAGASDGAKDVNDLQARELDVGAILLGRYVERGATILAERRQRNIPSEKTIKNLIACCKALQVLALDGKDPKQAGRSASQRRRSRPKRQTLPHYSQSEWSAELEQAWAGYAAWKTKPILTPAEGKRYRKGPCRAITIATHRERVNPMIGWLKRHKGHDIVTLRDLANPQNYAEYLNWALTLFKTTKSGYSNARMTGITLTTLSRYLVATNALPEHTQEGEYIWSALYSLSQEPMREGAKRGHLLKAADIGDWTPQALLQLGLQGWNTDPIRRQRGNEGRWANQRMVRKRSALFFILAHETPLRARNFREMRWHHNLNKQPDGLWRVTFTGEELKVSQRGYHTNEYQRPYSPNVSHLLDEWHNLLEQRLGPDFEHDTPYVFPRFRHTQGNHGPIQHAAFANCIKDLCEELRGEPFNLHSIRHIVGTYVTNQLGPAGLGLAAEILGDQVTTVLRAYYRPDTTSAYQNYLKQVQEDQFR